MDCHQAIPTAVPDHRAGRNHAHTAALLTQPAPRLAHMPNADPLHDAIAEFGAAIYADVCWKPESCTPPEVLKARVDATRAAVLAASRQASMGGAR